MSQQHTHGNPDIPPEVLGRIPFRSDNVADDLAAIRAELRALRWDMAEGEELHEHEAAPFAGEANHV